MSSSAPNVGISPAVAPSQRPPTLPSPQDNGTATDTSPFALLLDAAAAAPPTAGPQQPTGAFTVSQRAPAAGDQGNAKLAGRNDADTATAQNTGPTAPAPADPTKGASTANVNTPPAQNPPAGPAGATTPSDLIGNDPQLAAFVAALAAPANNNAPVQSATPGSTTKTASDTSDGSQDDSGNGTDAGATTAAGQPQPLAAVFVANATIATPPAADATTSNAAIGASGGASALSPSIGTAALATDQGAQSASASTADAQAPADGNPAAAQAGNDASAPQSAGTASFAQSVKTAAIGQDATVAAPINPDGKIAAPATQNPKAATPGQGAKTTPPQPSATADGAAAANADNANAASPADPTSNQAWNGAAAPQPPLHADGDDGVPSQSTGHGDGFAPSDAGGAANTQGASNAAKPIDGLPNFGFAAIAQTAPTAATAAPTAAAAATAAVPIAGLPVAIAARALDGTTQFDIRLDPPELGRIAVRLDVDREGQVTSHVTVDRADTLQLLQSQQPQLERALEQAGLKTADNGLQFTLRDQSFAGQNGQSGQGGSQANTATIVIPDADQPAIPSTQAYSRFARVSGIDIRV